jgi:hypothetical protein
MFALTDCMVVGLLLMSWWWMLSVTDCMVVGGGAAVVLVMDVGSLGQSQALRSRGEPEGIRGCCVWAKCGRDEQASEHIIRRPYYYPDRLRSYARKSKCDHHHGELVVGVGPPRPRPTTSNNGVLAPSPNNVKQWCAGEHAAGGS